MFNISCTWGLYPTWCCPLIRCPLPRHLACYTCVILTMFPWLLINLLYHLKLVISCINTHVYNWVSSSDISLLLLECCFWFPCCFACINPIYPDVQKGACVLGLGTSKNSTLKVIMTDCKIFTYPGYGLESNTLKTASGQWSQGARGVLMWVTLGSSCAYPFN